MATTTCFLVMSGYKIGFARNPSTLVKPFGLLPAVLEQSRVSLSRQNRDRTFCSIVLTLSRWQQLAIALPS
eukprot:scaffold201986_cov22-Cyclotella_meneghiniana.AAC.3